jgi:hypothetical protein
MNGLEILDTAVKIGLGAMIAAISGFGLEVYRRRMEQVRLHEEQRRAAIETPIVAFVDEMLIRNRSPIVSENESQYPNARIKSSPRAGTPGL